VSLLVDVLVPLIACGASALSGWAVGRYARRAPPPKAERPSSPFRLSPPREVVIIDAQATELEAWSTQEPPP
jgi:hypothetical protein